MVGAAERDRVERRLDDFRKRLNQTERFILDSRVMTEESMTLNELGERFHV